MKIKSSDLLMIDTNVLIHWIRQDSTGKHLIEQYHLEQRAERPLLSTVSEGEILGLAKCWNWGETKLAKLNQLFDELVRVEAGLPEVIANYSEIYFEAHRIGRSHGENDLWIAASARATGAVLLTCDSDFRWMSPKLLTVEYVPETR